MDFLCFFLRRLAGCFMLWIHMPLLRHLLWLLPFSSSPLACRFRDTMNPPLAPNPYPPMVPPPGNSSAMTPPSGSYWLGVLL
ncbi:hypothetical protein B0J15DRAFT_478895 [Fusarium solani]|uniref:Uncharacterized protein n=1 Tax=Fusarium solani TaxID=169388 RepID=A0A9P9RC36_FUSSL|nr:uncharacterized protein B0J15DRAFT_478895 [Fusarium solani]KAH7274101.1 hypothetical protein B0J15DRAFT_478895 [Fusarium solani]